MADINQIKVGSTTYDIKDSTLCTNLKDGSGAGAIMNIHASEASGNYSLAEGYLSSAKAICSHAESGFKNSYLSKSTVASGNYSHAEPGAETVGTYASAGGLYSKASSNYSHAYGYFCNASAAYSHASGYYNEVISMGQFACGQYSITDTSTSGGNLNGSNYGKVAFRIGNGSYSARKNAFAIDWTGHYYLNMTSENDYPIGAYIESEPSSDIVLSAGTFKTVCSITLPRGVWMFVCGIRASNNSSNSGYLRANLNTEANNNIHIQAPLLTTRITQVTMPRVIDNSNSSIATVFLNVQTGHESTCTSTGTYIRGVRIA